MEFIIDRSKWINGDNLWERGYVELLNSSGYYCCLGLIGKQLGFADNELLNIAQPGCAIRSGDNDSLDFVLCKLGMQSAYHRMMTWNDSTAIGLDREQRLQREANKCGHTLRFVGSAEPVRLNIVTNSSPVFSEWTACVPSV